MCLFFNPVSDDCIFKVMVSLASIFATDFLLGILAALYGNHLIATKILEKCILWMMGIRGSGKDYLCGLGQITVPQFLHI